MLGFVDRHPVVCAMPIILTMLIIAAVVADVTNKSERQQASQNRAQEFRAKLSMGSKEQFDASLEELKKLIAQTGGIVQGTSWSEKEVDGFVGPTWDCVGDFIVLMHETSQDGEELYGRRVIGTLMELNDGMTKVVSTIQNKKARSSWKLAVSFGTSGLMDKLPPKKIK
jgi:hypothetical protein